MKRSRNRNRTGSNAISRSPGGGQDAILMQDGTSGVLMEDGTSDILLERTSVSGSTPTFYILGF